MQTSTTRVNVEPHGVASFRTFGICRPHLNQYLVQKLEHSMLYKYSLYFLWWFNSLYLRESAVTEKKLHGPTIIKWWHQKQTWLPVYLPVTGSLFGAFAAISRICSSVGFMAGNSNTSLMLSLLERNMVRRSTPNPNPPVGGRPCSKAVTKDSSITMASSSPALPSNACPMNSLCWMTGSFNSV